MTTAKLSKGSPKAKAKVSRKFSTRAAVLATGFVLMFGGIGAYIIQTSRAATPISCETFSASPSIAPGRTSTYTFRVRNNTSSATRVIVDYGDNTSLFKEVDYGTVTPYATKTRSVTVTTPKYATKVIAYAGSTSKIMCSKTVWTK